MNTQEQRVKELKEQGFTTDEAIALAQQEEILNQLETEGELRIHGE